MTLSFVPITLPSTADQERLKDFGREVQGVRPQNLTQAEFKDLEEALSKYTLLRFCNVVLTPEEQYNFVKRFDPNSEHYGHGNRALEQSKASIIHAYVKSLPSVPQVQIIGHGTVRNHEGIDEITLKHGRHAEFHKTRVSEEDEHNFTRFFRWHMDAALYGLNPPKVTALYGIKVPKGPMQMVRYDDGSGDTLPVTLGTTAFVSGKIMFDILPDELKNLAVRSKAKYAPHPFQWIRDAKALSTGFGIESEGLETPLTDLPVWEEEKVKEYPFVWKNPVTGDLCFMVHPCVVREINVDPVPAVSEKAQNKTLYPDGGVITDLKEIRSLLYRMQRPGISPELVYPHPWEENDLVIFNNRTSIHSVVGVFNESQIRLFHQCNLARSDEPIGPDEADVKKWCA